MNGTDSAGDWRRPDATEIASGEVDATTGDGRSNGAVDRADGADDARDGGPDASEPDDGEGADSANTADATEGADAGRAEAGADAPDGAAKGADATTDATTDADADADAAASADGADAPTGSVSPVDAGPVDAGPVDAGEPSTDVNAADAPPDAPPDVADAGAPAPPGCDPNAPFVTITPVQGLPPPGVQQGSISGTTLSPDERTIWFSSGPNLWSGTRQNIRDVFGFFQALPTFSGTDLDPTITADLDTLFFSDADGGLREATRSGPSATFSGGGAVPGVLTAGMMIVKPFVVADGSAVYFALLLGNPVNGYARIASSSSAGGSFSAPQQVEELDPGSTSLSDTSPVLSADALTLYWARIDETVVPVTPVISVAHRASRGAAFGGITQVTELNGQGGYLPRWLSPDGCRLYLELFGGIFVAER